MCRDVQANLPSVLARGWCCFHPHLPLEPWFIVERSKRRQEWGGDHCAQEHRVGAVTQTSADL